MSRSTYFFLLLFIFGTNNNSFSQNAFFTYDNHCLNNLIYFTDESKIDEPIVSWFWDFGDDAVSTDSSPIHAYSESGVYTVSLSIRTENGTSYTTDKKIEITTPPFAFFSPKELCDQKVEFSDNSFTRASEVKVWMWDFGDGNYSLDKNPTHQFANSESKSVNLKVIDSYGCGDSISQTIKLKPLPQTGFDINSVIMSNPAIIQINSHNEKDSVFYLINNELINAQNATVKIDINREVEINQKVIDSIGCSDSLKQTINLKQHFFVEFPASFDTSKNNKLAFQLGEHTFVDLKIMNRKNKVVFRQKNQSVFWDGIDNQTSQIAEEGLYHYNLEFKTTKGIKVTQQGSFQLMSTL